MDDIAIPGFPDGRYFADAGCGKSILACKTELVAEPHKWNHIDRG